MLLIAQLFAFHPCWFERVTSDRRPDLGESFRRLARATATKPDEIPEPVQRRFEALLAAHADDLPYQLRQAISLLKAKEIPVDWPQLLADLSAWSYQDHPVQFQWSRSLYLHVGGEETDAS
jgi:CRISPR system Cascade subunit CasB